MAALALSPREASFDTWLSVASALFAAVAAGAAVLAIRYAKQTIEAAEAESVADASRHSQQMEDLTSLLEATRKAHEEEASDRRLLYDHDLAVRPRYGRILAATPIMALQTKLRMKVVLLKASTART